MQTSKNTYSNPNPKLYANFLSRLIFGWLYSLFKHGKNHVLFKRDLYDVLPEDLSEKLGNNLERCWNNELDDAYKNKKEPKFLKAIRKYLGWSYVKYGINMFLLNMFVRVVQPLVLGNLVSQFYPNSTNSSLYTYLHISALVGLMILQVFLIQHANFGLSVVGMRLRIACSSLVYRKMTKLSCSSVHQVPGGTIPNILSSDVTKFETLFVSFHYVWIIPLQVIVMAYLMWQRIGVASLIGIAFMTLSTIPLQFLIGRIISTLRFKAAIMTDKRILIVSELIDGISTIKMYVWEKPFEKLVSLTRSREIGIIKLYSYLKGISLASLMFTNLTTMFFTLLVYVLQGNAISANTVYVITYYYYYLRLTLTYHFPNAVNLLAEASASVRRIERFLLLEEVERRAIETSSSSADAGQLFIRNVSAKWSEKSISDTLSDISISVIPRKLYAVVGTAGAGKSSLLKLILSELRAKTGNVSVSGSISYASQEPCLFVGSLRSNILFGEAYDEIRYRKVVRVCALERDFECLLDGDRTLVGDRGAALSDGQCARVNLARAVYRNADVYLLDDPLSVVDTEVGKQVFCDCIDGLLKNKTRILVTHQLQYFKKADFIIFLNNGRVEFLGTYREFQSKELLRHSLLFREKLNKSENCLISNETFLDDQNSYECGASRSEKYEESPQETEELLEQSEVKKAFYWKYFRSGGSYFVLIATVACFIIAQVLLSASTYWIAYWSQCEDPSLNSSTTSLSNEHNFQTIDTYNSLWILGGLIFSGVLMCIVSNVLFFKCCMDANKNIHENMISHLLQAPIKFFQNNPSGRILNQFSKDTAAADETLPVSMLQTIQWCSIIVGHFLQILIVNWLMVIPLCVLVYFYGKIKDIYLVTAHNIKRLESISRSPVLSHVNSSLAGLLTIRAFNAEVALQREFDERQNDHTAAHFLVVASSVAFGFWIDAASVAFVALVSYSLAVCATLGGISTGASYVGLALTQVVGLCGSVQSCLRNYGETVAQMTNVERMQQMSQLESEELDKEDDERLALTKPPVFWPAKGEIRFERVSLRYSPDAPLALKNLNFTIRPGTKVGVIGRTGAGKSSLVSALLRLTQFDGSIFIDGVDIAKLPPRDLRTKISIVPQEPKIFTTSVRRNLNAHDRLNDSLLWSALDAVELKHVVSSLDASLEYGGAGLSVGQRQLLCLARTILENNRILALDEATANVDAVTDELISRTVRRQFRDCTVITIARRFNTVMDSDRILVLDEGELVEYDEPEALLARSDSYLARMLEQSGKTMAEDLRSIVEQGVKEDTENGCIR